MTKAETAAGPPPGRTGQRAAAPEVRWPAEWEAHAATWLAWPHNRETWGERLAAVEAVFAQAVAELSRGERVRILAGNPGVRESALRALRNAGVEPTEPTETARQAEFARPLEPGRPTQSAATGDRAGPSESPPGCGVEFVSIETDDSWIRDSGPIFVERARGDGGVWEREAACFEFDTWGGKYPPWDRDAAVAQGVAAQAGAPPRRYPAVLEGGSIDGDGAGTVLTTEECLLHPNRGGGRARSRDALEHLLGEALGVRQVIWLGRGIAGDDTDGHVDDITRFVAPGVVVTAVEPNRADPNHEPLARNRERLRSARDAAGKPLSVVELPMPPPLVLAGQRLPASYANFYLANGLALVPVFGAPRDAEALAILAELLEGRRVVGLPAADLVVGLGAIHCLSQQEPRLRSAQRRD